MPLSSAAIGNSNPSAPGARRRMAMWAATNSPSTTPRNGPMFAGIDDVRVFKRREVGGGGGVPARADAPADDAGEQHEKEHDAPCEPARTGGLGRLHLRSLCRSRVDRGLSLGVTLRGALADLGCRNQ